jgi:ribosomal protein S18 acetylase RimI-like enzyme
MSVVRHTDVEAFLAAARPALARSEPTHALYTVLAQSLQTPAVAAKPYYLATYADGPRIGAAMQLDGGPFIVEDADPEAAVAFAVDYARDHGELREVVGVPAACEAFARVWCAHAGCAPALGVRMRHHVLAEVADVPAVGGSMRPAIAADLDWLVAAQLAFVVDVNLRDPPDRVRRVVPERFAQDRFRIWWEGGERVAYGGWSDAGPRFGRIAPVWTPAAFRRRGYATALVAELARELLAKGKERVFLVTDLANPTSNAIYARIGFRPLHDTHRIDFQSSQA